MSNNQEEDLNKNNNSIEMNKIEESKNDKQELDEKIQKLKSDLNKTKIIDELPKNKIPENKNVKTAYRLVFVFRNEDININVKPELKIINVIKKISKKIDMPIEKFYIKYNDKTITEKDNEKTVKEFFDFPKNKSRPILYIKVKQNNEESNKKNYLYNSTEIINKSNLFGKSNYINKVKITNYPSITDLNVSSNDDIYSIINLFLKEAKINSDFIVERKENKKKQNENLNSDENNMLESYTFDLNDNSKIIYIVGFPTPDIAFDFNRYMNILKLINPVFKDMKISLLIGSRKSPKKFKQFIFEEQTKSPYIGLYSNLEGTNPEQKNIEVIAKIRNNYINNQITKMNSLNNLYRYGYLNSGSPYSTPYEEVLKEKHENKKRWLNPRGFISAVNKYSGVNL